MKKLKNMKHVKYIKLVNLMVLVIIVAGIFWVFKNNETNNDFNEDKLVVVSPHPIDFMEPLIHEFETETGIEVQVESYGTTDSINMILSDDGIDLMWGGSVMTVGSYVDEFYLYKSANYDSFYPEFRDSSGRITYFTDVPSILMVNTDIVGQIKIKGYEDLLNPELKGKIAYALPANSSSSFEHLVNMLYAMGNGDPERGWDYVGKLIEQIDGNFLNSSSEVYNGVANGSYVVGLTFEEAAITMLNAEKHVSIVYMAEGVVSTPDGIYINKNSDKLFEAETFVDFMTSYDTQVFISKNLGRRSVRTDVSNSTLALAKDQINIIQVDKNYVIANKEIWIEKFSAMIEGDNN